MSYDQLLKGLYEKLPKKITVKERFEIPLLDSFIQGKQTVIKNLSEAAGVVRRDPSHIMRYISRELATPGVFDGKRGTLTGKFRNDQIQPRFQNYVKEYVLCSECGKPDTNIVKNDGVEHKRCEVCGARAPVKHI